MRPQKRLRAPPPITDDARRSRVPASSSACLPVGEREGDALEHGAAEVGARRVVREAEEDAASRAGSLCGVRSPDR